MLQPAEEAAAIAGIGIPPAIGRGFGRRDVGRLNAGGGLLGAVPVILGGLPLFAILADRQFQRLSLNPGDQNPGLLVVRQVGEPSAARR